MRPARLPSVSAAMALLSDDDVIRVVQSLEARGFEVRHKDKEPGGAVRVVLEEKYFRRIDKFGGETSDWQEWLFNLCVAVSGVSRDCVRAMETVVQNANVTLKPQTIGTILQKDLLDKYSSELFGILCTLTSGEANVVVRSVVQKGLGYCGFAALCLLSQRFNPKTPTRVLQLLTAVLHPPAVKDVRLLSRAVEEWELQRGKLRSEFGEELSNNVQVAILTGMVPRDLQDMVFQLGHQGADLKYQEVRDKVMGVANHRALMTVPVPMEVGRIGTEGDDWGDRWHEAEEEKDVDAVGKGCLRCGGWGHFARECPTPDGKGIKGKGKSRADTHKGPGKGHGRATGKGEYTTSKGGGKKGSGKGWGYQGTCWNCGVVGHKAAECQAGKGIHGVAEEVRDVASVGGVWMIGAVEKYHRSVGSCSTEAPESSESVGSGRAAMAPSRNVATEEERAAGGPVWKTVPGKWRPRVVGHGRSSIAVGQGRFGALDICHVEADVCALKTDITVDSAAEESVCPQGWAAHFGTTPVPEGKGLRLVNASGGPISHYGSRRVAFQPNSSSAVEGRIMGMGFEVTDVKKPLMAVSRICEKGNVVQFGPEDSHNFIQNIQTGEKLYMKKKGNSYVLEGALADQNPF